MANDTEFRGVVLAAGKGKDPERLSDSELEGVAGGLFGLFFPMLEALSSSSSKASSTQKKLDGVGESTIRNIAG